MEEGAASAKKVEGKEGASSVEKRGGKGGSECRKTGREGRQRVHEKEKGREGSECRKPGREGRQRVQKKGAIPCRYLGGNEQLLTSYTSPGP